MIEFINRPSASFIAASWIALVMGAGAYLIGLWNANLPANEKGYYLTIVLFGLFAIASLQKTIRDRLEGIPVTQMYFALCWIATLSSISLLFIGLYNANLALSEKGFYIMAFALALFGTLTTQKNIRDLDYLRRHTKQLKDKNPILQEPDEIAEE